MENREDLSSILPFLPLILRSSSLFWPPKTRESFKALALGPDVSHVSSGEVLFDAILDLRDSLGLSSDRLAYASADGYSIFFDELMSRMDAKVWFGEVVPGMARLLLRLPSLLEAHYRHSDGAVGEGKTGLRIMSQQEAGIVLLSQELIAALLSCALFCLFPDSDRGTNHLPNNINFDYLFAALYPSVKQSQEQKVKCLIHYFERICLSAPTGFVSFERKVLPLDHTSHSISYPEAVFWRTSVAPLCTFEVFSSGLIEDQLHEAIEVDFANEYLGGGALHRGCVQEEIRFMVNPELIVGILFMSSMAINEAIEIVGVERYSCYMGYGSSFRFLGDYFDKKPLDSMGRRKTRIVAIDAMCTPGFRQYGVKCLVRETNKAFCGFFDKSKCQCYLKFLKVVELCKSNFHEKDQKIYKTGCNSLSVFGHRLLCLFSQFVQNRGRKVPNRLDPYLRLDYSDTCTEAKSLDISAPSDSESASDLNFIRNIKYENGQLENSEENIGIATGNWGCGAFGGDPEIKVMIQWLAASQALRPFIHYYTFGQEDLQRLAQVTRWISTHKWTVGDLWAMLLEYSSQRLNMQTNVGFLRWLLPEDNTPSDVMLMSE